MASASAHAAECVPLSKLSMDVFAIIAGFLETSDIQSARLAGRDLHMFLSPYLFRAITFAPHLETLDRLDKISQHSVLSFNTRILRFDTSISRLPNLKHDLDELEFRRHYAWHTRTLTMPNVRLRPCFSLDCVETLEEYASYVLDQDTILKQLEHHLSQVIAAFPKLSTIIICNTHMHSSERFMSVLQRNSISRKWVRKNQFMALLRAIADTPSCNITRITVEGHWIEKAFRFLNNGNFGDDHETLGSIQYCLGPAFMTASYPKEKIPFMHGSSFSLNAQELLTAKSIFSNLTQLKLGIFTAVPLEEFYMDPADVAKTYWAEFPKVLQSLTKVVDLSLDMKIRRAVDQQHSCDYYHDDIAELFENRSITFPYLKRLKLSQFRSRGSSVNAFLERHPNIVDLTLNFIIQIKTEYNPWDDRWAVWTPDPQWIQCVETMNALKLHRLDLRGIEGFGCDYSRYGSENENLTLARIHDYILHGYGDNPLPMRLPLKENGLSWDREFWYTDDECMSSWIDASRRDGLLEWDDV